jgi:hypothetical protein
MAVVFRVGYACGQPAVTRHGWALLLRAREQQIRRRFAAIATKFFAGNLSTATPRATPCPNPGATPHPAMAVAPQRGENGPASAMPRYSDVLRDEAVTYAGYLRDLMHDPEMLAVLAGSPQARRTLRELMRLYSYEGPLPDCMRSPPRRSPPRRSPSRRRRQSAPASADAPPASPTAQSAPPADAPPAASSITAPSRTAPPLAVRPSAPPRLPAPPGGGAAPSRPRLGRLRRDRPRISTGGLGERLPNSFRYQEICELRFASRQLQARPCPGQSPGSSYLVRKRTGGHRALPRPASGARSPRAACVLKTAVRLTPRAKINTG